MTSVRVYLHNETEQTLVLEQVVERDGGWLGGPAPAAIAPGAVAMTGTSALAPAIPTPFGEVEIDGTECRLRYRGEHDASPTRFEVHWNNPAIGKVTIGLGGVRISEPRFHTGADETSYAFWRAEGRADAVVHFHLRDARTVLTDFRPANDGFRFSNSGWVGTDAGYTLPVLEGTPLAFEVGDANAGVCGGMVFAALDYFLAEQRIPQDRTNPPPGSALF